MTQRRPIPYGFFKYVMQFKWILILLILGAAKLNASGNDSIHSQAEPWDVSKVDYRKVPIDTIEYYRSLPEYQFEIAKKPNTFWERFLRWLRQLYKGGESDINWFNVILISLAVVTFTVIVVFLFGVKIKGLFMLSRKMKSADIGFIEHTDDIHNTRLDEMLITYIENKIWRDATRILYLICIRELNNHKFIEWDISKTNRDYFYEIESTELKNQFKQLVLNYEYVWYGQFPVDELKFNDINQLANSIIGNLKQAG